MATGDKNDIKGRIQALIPPWFSDSAPYISAMLAGLAAAWTNLYALYAYAKLQTRVRTATDGWLDMISADYFGTALPRKSAESDAPFRSRILANLLREKGTRYAIYRALLDLTSRPPVITEPQRPADTGAYMSGAMTSKNPNVPASGYIAFAQAGAARSLTMDAGANTTSDYYASTQVNIVGGTGAGQQRNVVASRKQWCPNSNNFTAANWSNVVDTLVTPAATTAPDGTLTASKLYEAATNGYHSRFTQVAFGAGTNTRSICAKAAEKSWIYLQQYDGITNWGVYFNLSTGAIGNSTGGCVGTMIPAGNGFYRCSVTFPSAGSIERVQLALVNSNGGSPVYVGDGVSGVYICNAHLNTGATADEYINNPTASPVIGIATDTTWTTVLDATSVFDISPIYQMSAVSVPMGAAYGVAGGYGSLLCQYQAFVIAYRPSGSSLPYIAGYGISTGAYGVASRSEYSNIADMQGSVQDADIYAAVEAAKPVGTEIWVAISN